MSEYRELTSFVTCMISNGICAVAWRAKLDKKITQSIFSLPLIIGFANAVTCTNDFVTNNHHVFPVVDWQQLLLMIEVILKLLV